MFEDKAQILRENTADMQVSPTTLSVGEILRRARLQMGLSLQQAEADIRIVSNYLDALEVGDYERLPAQVYVVGFVKTYSDYLNLDAAKMVQLLKKQTGHKVVKPVNVFAVVTDEKKIPSLKIIGGSTALLVFILIVWNLSSGRDRGDEIPAMPKELARQMTAPQKPAVPASQPVVEAAKAKPHPVVLKAVADVWLEIRDAGSQPIFSRVLKKGEEYWVPPEAVGYKMTTGNAGGLEMVVEGVSLPAMGRAGEVKRNISLNPQDLKGIAPAAPVVAQ